MSTRDDATDTDRRLTWVRRRCWELMVVAAILLGLVALFIPVIRSAHNPDGPAGEMIPRDPPHEAHRVHLAPDFSMVLPKNWVVKLAGPPGGLRAFVHPRALHRLPASLSISDSEDPPDLSEMQPVQFQGAPAFERMRVVRHNTFDDPPRSDYELHFDRGGRWWSVTYCFIRETTELPPVIRQYIETLRWEDRSALQDEKPPQINPP